MNSSRPARFTIPTPGDAAVQRRRFRAVYHRRLEAHHDSGSAGKSFEDTVVHHAERPLLHLRRGKDDLRRRGAEGDKSRDAILSNRAEADHTKQSPSPPPANDRSTMKRNLLEISRLGNFQHIKYPTEFLFNANKMNPNIHVWLFQVPYSDNNK